jgi:hypothetical protein
VVGDHLRTVTGVAKTLLESNDSPMRRVVSSMQDMGRRMAALT